MYQTCHFGYEKHTHKCFFKYHAIKVGGGGEAKCSLSLTGGGVWRGAKSKFFFILWNSFRVFISNNFLIFHFFIFKKHLLCWTDATMYTCCAYSYCKLLYKSPVGLYFQRLWKSDNIYSRCLFFKIFSNLSNTQTWHFTWDWKSAWQPFIHI